LGSFRQRPHVKRKKKKNRGEKERKAIPFPSLHNPSLIAEETWQHLRAVND